MTLDQIADLSSEQRERLMERGIISAELFVAFAEQYPERIADLLGSTPAEIERWANVARSAGIRPCEKDDAPLVPPFGLTPSQDRPVEN